MKPLLKKENQVLNHFSILAASVLLFTSAPGAKAQEHSETAADSSLLSEMTQSMKKMDDDMLAAPMTGNPDHDMSAMMIPHHQGAIDMAREYLAHGRDPVLRRLAQEMIVTQTQEIDVLHRRLAFYDKAKTEP